MKKKNGKKLLVEPGHCANDANKGLCEGHFGQFHLMFGT